MEPLTGPLYVNKKVNKGQRKREQEKIPTSSLLALCLSLFCVFVLFLFISTHNSLPCWGCARNAVFALFSSKRPCQVYDRFLYSYFNVALSHTIHKSKK